MSFRPFLEGVTSKDGNNIKGVEHLLDLMDILAGFEAGMRPAHWKGADI